MTKRFGTYIDNLNADVFANIHGDTVIKFKITKKYIFATFV